MMGRMVKRSFGYTAYTWTTSFLSGNITKSAQKFPALEGQIKDL